MFQTTKQIKFLELGSIKSAILLIDYLWTMHAKLPNSFQCVCWARLKIGSQRPHCPARRNALVAADRGSNQWSTMLGSDERSIGTAPLQIVAFRWTNSSNGPFPWSDEIAMNSKQPEISLEKKSIYTRDSC